MEFIPIGDHVVLGETAMEREKSRPGTGEFTVIRQKQVLEGVLDGWAMFAAQPAMVMEQVNHFRKLIPL
jgi:hypothetical protein